MHRRLSKRRDTLDEHMLPRGKARETELNHRTDILLPRRSTVATLFGIGRQIAWSLAFLLPTLIPNGGYVWVLGAVVFSYLSYKLFSSLLFLLRRMPFWDPIIWVFSCVALAVPVFWFATARLSQTQVYLFCFGPAVCLAAWLSHVMAKQSAHWMSVNVRLEKSTVKEWQGYWSYIFKPMTPDACREIESYRVGFIMLFFAYVFGYVAMLVVYETFPNQAGLIGIAAFGLACLLFWGLWAMSSIAPRLRFKLVPRVVWQGLVNWQCYNSHQTNAAGVFQFPTVWTRRIVYRRVASFAVLIALGLSVTKLMTWSLYPFTENVINSLPMPPPPFYEPQTFKQAAPGQSIYLDISPPYRGPFYPPSPLADDWQDVSDFFVMLGKGLLCYLAVLVIAPYGLFLITNVTLSARLLTAYYAALEAEDASEVKPSHWPWDNRVDRVLNSSNPLEREHLYIGRSVYGDYPVYLHLGLLHQHAHILGDTGSRKTSVGIAPLITQLIARADSSVLILDLKGDKSLFECAKDEAELAGLPFRYFTNVVGRSSHVFNPFQQTFPQRLTVNQKTQGLLQALALAYGEDYGEGFFSSVSEIVLTTYLSKYKNINSFKQLYKYVNVPRVYKAIGGEIVDWRKARHLAILLKKLSEVHPLNLTADDLADKPQAHEQRIDIPRMFDEKQVVYFSLSSALEPTTVNPIGRLALFQLLAAAAQVAGAGQRVYVVIDEFQRIVTETMRLFLEQARDFKVHILMANQTMGQLKSRKRNLTDVVEACTAYKHMFRATDLESMLRIERASGEAGYSQIGWNPADQTWLLPSASRAFIETLSGFLPWAVRIGPRLERNTIIELSASPWTSLVRFSEGSGFTQFSGYYTPIIHEFHIHEEFYQERKNRPWPAERANTVTVTDGEDAPLKSEDAEPVETLAALSIAARLDEDAADDANETIDEE